MSERCNDIFKDNIKKWSMFCPVIYESGKIIFDRETEGYYVLGTFVNTQALGIAELDVTYDFYDKKYDEKVSKNYRYSYGYVVKRNMTIGDDIKVEIQPRDIKRFDVRVNEVVFDNGIVWHSGEYLVPLSGKMETFYPKFRQYSDNKKLCYLVYRINFKHFVKENVFAIAASSIVVLILSISLIYTMILYKKNEQDKGNIYNQSYEEINELDGDDIVQFSNNIVEEYVRKNLKKEGNISVADLDIFQELKIRNKNLSDISDLKYFRKLEKLYLNNNNIEDLSPLANKSSITEVMLDCNKIRDISTLGTLKNLRIASIKKNKISDISCIENMPSIKRIYLDENDIKNVDIFERKTDIDVVSLDSNFIKNVKPFSYMEDASRISLLYNPVENWDTITNIRPVNGRTYNLNIVLTYNRSAEDYDGWYVSIRTKNADRKASYATKNFYFNEDYGGNIVKYSVTTCADRFEFTIKSNTGEKDDIIKTRMVTVDKTLGDITVRLDVCQNKEHVNVTIE